MSGGNYYLKKMMFILFINLCLVECVLFKCVCELVYVVIFFKVEKLFVFMYFRLSFEDVDVNVYFTK